MSMDMAHIGSMKMGNHEDFELIVTLRICTGTKKLNSFEMTPFCDQKYGFWHILTQNSKCLENVISCILANTKAIYIVLHIIGKLLIWRINLDIHIHCIFIGLTININ